MSVDRGAPPGGKAGWGTGNEGSTGTRHSDARLKNRVCNRTCTSCPHWTSQTPPCSTGSPLLPHARMHIDTTNQLLCPVGCQWFSGTASHVRTVLANARGFSLVACWCWWWLGAGDGGLKCPPMAPTDRAAVARAAMVLPAGAGRKRPRRPAPRMLPGFPRSASLCAALVAAAAPACGGAGAFEGPPRPPLGPPPRLPPLRRQALPAGSASCYFWRLPPWLLRPGLDPGRAFSSGATTSWRYRRHPRLALRSPCSRPERARARAHGRRDVLPAWTFLDEGRRKGCEVWGRRGRRGRADLGGPCLGARGCGVDSAGEARCGRC